MPTLQRGENSPVPAGDLQIVVEWIADPNVHEIDAAAFMLGSAGKVSGDADMIFYGQPDNGLIRFERSPSLIAGRDATSFSISASAISGSVERIAFTGTLHDAASRGIHFGRVGGVRISVRSGSAEAASFELPPATEGETALILAELYRRDGRWKFRAVGQGYAGGLAPLAQAYGVDLAEPASSAPPAPPPPSPPAARPVNLSKVSLTKERPSVSLEKRADFGDITVNLNWSRGKRGGLFSRGSSGVDLDIGCLFELADGWKGCIQALGDSYGSYSEEPYLALDGDDRSGDFIDGEWLRVNGRHFKDIRRLLVFAFIYEGVPNWTQTDGVVTVRIPGEPPIEVRMDEGSNAKNMCAVALIENDGGRMQISREVRYFRGHSQMDTHYGWGLRWQAGSKD